MNSSDGSMRTSRDYIWRESEVGYGEGTEGGHEAAITVSALGFTNLGVEEGGSSWRVSWSIAIKRFNPWALGVPSPTFGMPPSRGYGIARGFQPNLVIGHLRFDHQAILVHITSSGLERIGYRLHDVLERHSHLL